LSEGPNVVLWARAVRQLVDQPLTEVTLPAKHRAETGSLIGGYITAVDTHGKNLFVRFSDGRVLSCHGMMAGYWRVGRIGVLGRPGERVLVRLCTNTQEAAFINGPIAELLTPEQLAAHPRLSALGPDVMSDRFDRDEAWRRLHEFRTEIGESLVEQKVVAGIGNIYKCEILFVAGIDPRRKAAEIPRPDVERIWDTAIPMMWNEVDCGGRWTTLPAGTAERTGEKHWVYGRGRRPCFACSKPVQFCRQGRYKRTTFFCGACQT